MMRINEYDDQTFDTHENEQKQKKNYNIFFEKTKNKKSTIKRKDEHH